MNSGMREVSAAITRLMCTSSIAMLQRQIAICLVELVRSADVTDRAELKSIHELLEVRRQEVGDACARASPRSRSRSPPSPSGPPRCRPRSRTSSSISDELIGSAKQMLRQRADAPWCASSPTTRPKPCSMRWTPIPSRGPGAATWRPCASGWRQRTSSSFEQAAADLARVEQFLYPQLKVIVASLLPGYQGSLLEMPAWPPGLTPSIAPLVRQGDDGPRHARGGGNGSRRAAPPKSAPTTSTA